eukprot:9462605-Pyramimonas_sp.AAC.1
MRFTLFSGVTGSNSVTRGPRRGCELKSEHSFLGGANGGRKRTADGHDEAKAKPPAQPAGGSASSAAKPPPLCGVHQAPKLPPPRSAGPPAPPVPTSKGDMTAAGSFQEGVPAYRGTAAR